MGRGVGKKSIRIIICMALVICLGMPYFAAADTADDGAGTGVQTEDVQGGDGTGVDPGEETGSADDIEVIDMTPVSKPSITSALDRQILGVEGRTVRADISYRKMLKKVKKKKVVVKREYRSLAKQKMYGYDTFQGAASDGKYAYHVMCCEKKQKCKIAKIRVSTGHVVKVSGPLKIGHGNDATYDYSRKELVTTYKRGQTRYVAVIDPKTLRLKRYQKLHFPEKIPGLNKKSTKAIKGIAAIAYDKSTGNFIGRIKKWRSFIVIDRDYNVIGYIHAKSYKDYLCQTIECTDKVILHAQSPQKKGQKFNIISVYDYDGNYLATIKTARSGREIESIYRVGKKLYAGEYHSHYKTKTKYVKKKVKVRNKKGKVVRTKKGKVKYKKKKVKIKYKKFYRDNHIYKIDL